MEKLTPLILSLILSLTIFVLTPSVRSDLSVSPILTACPGIKKSSKIQFYIQDRLSGVNQSVYQVAQASITPTSPSTFGLVRVFDVKLTAGPDYNSPEVGRAQGIGLSADLKVLALALNFNVYFTTGIYNGSTISIIGRNPLFSQKNRELAVVGGTGIFGCARGYAIANTNSTEPMTLNSVFLYTVYVDYN